MKRPYIILTFVFFVALITIAAVFSRYFRPTGTGAKVESPTKSSLLKCADCNIILISLTNLRKKNLGIYGYSKPTSPAIDAFFSKALRAEHVFSPANITFTVAPSLLFSLQPTEHRIFDRRTASEDAKKLQSYVSLPKALSRRGYKSSAFVSDEDYTFNFGMGPEFDTYFDRRSYLDEGILFQPGQFGVGLKDLLPPTIEWLRENRDEKFFLFLQSFDLHCPFTPTGEARLEFDPGFQGTMNENDCYVISTPRPPVIKKGLKSYEFKTWRLAQNTKSPSVFLTEREIEHLKALYDGELLQTDRELAKLFQELRLLGLLEKTIVVLVSEHGDYLGENGYFMRLAETPEGNFHNAVLEVPLLIRAPSMQAAETLTHPIELIDLAPTLLEAVGGTSKETTFQGRNFGDPSTPLQDSAYSMTERHFPSGPFQVEALQDQHWKLIRKLDLKSNREELRLYDLQEDPEEAYNLAASRPEIKSEWLLKLQARRQAILK